MDEHFDFENCNDPNEVQQFIMKNKEKMNEFEIKLEKIRITHECEDKKTSDWIIHEKTIKERNTSNREYRNTITTEAIAEKFKGEVENLEMVVADKGETYRDGKDTVKRLLKRNDNRAKELLNNKGILGDMSTRALALQSEELQAEVKQQRYQVFSATETKECIDFGITNQGTVSTVEYQKLLDKLNQHRKAGDKITMCQLKNKVRNCKRVPKAKAETKPSNETK